MNDKIALKYITAMINDGKIPRIYIVVRKKKKLCHVEVSQNLFVGEGMINDVIEKMFKKLK